jgi:hypothetical protein
VVNGHFEISIAFKWKVTGIFWVKSHYDGLFQESQSLIFWFWKFLLLPSFPNENEEGFNLFKHYEVILQL